MRAQVCGGGSETGCESRVGVIDPIQQRVAGQGFSCITKREQGYEADQMHCKGMRGDNYVATRRGGF